MGFFKNLFKKRKNDEGVNNNLSIPSNESIINNIDNGVFQFQIEDVFSIRGKGIVATGNVISGTVSVGDYVLVNNKPCKVLGIEQFRKQLNSATGGDFIGLLVDEVSRDELIIGNIIVKK